MSLPKTLFLLFQFLFSSVSAQTQNKYDSLFANLQGGKTFSGQVLIADKKKIVYQKNFGVANEQTKTPITNNSVFNIASLTKQFTAIAIVLLEQKGKLLYDDKITKFFPELKTFSAISIRNLLNHTSGIPDYANSEAGNYNNAISTLFKAGTIPGNATLIKRLSESSIQPTFNAGEKYEYSNTNYDLLASVIEKVSGIAYANFLKQNIFIPLKMSHSFVVNHTPYENKNLAIGYMKDSLSRKVKPEQLEGFEPLRRTSGFVGSMGVFATAADLYKWITGLKTLLSASSYKQIMTPPIFTSGGRQDEYGFGFQLGYEKDFSRIAFHLGRFPGYSSYLEYGLHNGKAIILLQNNYNENTVTLIEAIKKLLYNIQPHLFLTLEAEDLKKLSGKYKTASGNIKEIIYKDNKLSVAMNPQVSFELKPISKTKFVVSGFQPEVQYEFIIDNGKAVKFINTQPEMGVRQEAVKVE